MKNLQLLSILSIILFSYSCKKEIIKVDKITTEKSNIKYAKGFDIIENNGVKKLIIKSAYKGSNDVFEYQIINLKKDSKPSVYMASAGWVRINL